MTLMVGLHDITTAYSQSFASGGRICGSVTITCERGGEVTLYTTPARAKAIENAVNGVAAEAEKEEHA